MQKIISLFQRNYDGDYLVRDEVTPGAEWVLAGEGVPTRKWDGTCVLIENGEMWKRHEVKAGKTAPPGFRPATDVDPVTGKQQGWLPIGDGPDDRWHREAVITDDVIGGERDYITGTTYELVGPKIHGNPERFDSHVLLRHGIADLLDGPRTFAVIRDQLATADMEGIVWHHPDGRMVKIKTKDFGLKRVPAPWRGNH